MSFIDTLLYHARVEPERPAVVLVDRVVTYGMLARVLRAIELRLAKAELAKGDVVGIRVGNPTRHLAMRLALQRAGLVSVALGNDEGVTAALALKAIASERIEPPRPGVKQFLVTDDWFAGGAEMAMPRPPVFDDGDDCCIMMSSGTTGRPKPVWLSPGVLEEWISQLTMSMAGGNFEIVMCGMSVTGAWGYAVALTALCGGKTLLLSDVARETLHMISLYRAEYLVCSGHQLRMLVECQNEHFVPCGSLRYIEVGGSLLMSEFATAARAKLGGRIISEYGTTETGQIARSPADRLPAVEGAVGQVMPWATIEALDGAGRVMPQGQAGILRLRSTAQGRWEDTGRRNAADDGKRWFYPGDVGFVRSDGCLVITGRVSDLINIGGVKIAPETIEQVLLSHPQVKDAGVAGFVGADGLEEVRAAVVLREPVEGAELIAFCAARIADGAPRLIRAVAEIPRNVGGKIVREQVRDLLT